MTWLASLLSFFLEKLIEKVTVEWKTENKENSCNYKIYLIYLYVCFACIYVYVPHTCMVPSGATREGRCPKIEVVDGSGLSATSCGSQN